MRCPRLDHFVRFQPNGTVSRCGHMIKAPEFVSLEQMEKSQWLVDIKEKFSKDEWPEECNRCQQTELLNNTSIRINSIHFDKLQSMPNYLVVGGVLDNICNSACMTCNAELSTKIGGLIRKDYIIYDNTNRFWSLPQERIVHLDINGGEPSASKNYRAILKKLPTNVRSVRVNTNCSLVIEELIDLVAKGIHVTVTVSFDGVGEVHDYVRWPIKWDKFYQNLMQYKKMNIHNLNLWTTISALNIGNFTSILEFVKTHEFNHSWALLNTPDPLNIKYTNNLTLPHKNVLSGQIAIDRNNQSELDKYITEQNQIRGI